MNRAPLHLLGAGRAATALGRLLHRAGRPVGAVVAAREGSAERAARIVGAGTPGTDPEAAFDTPRRWTRKPVPGELVGRVDSSPARILDVSYGGLRFELDDNAVLSLPPSFEINLPSKDVAVHVDLVWQSRTQEGSWLCGAALSQTDTATASAWHGLVDTLA